MTDSAEEPREGGKRWLRPLIAGVVLVVVATGSALFIVSWLADRRSRAIVQAVSDGGTIGQLPRPAEPTLGSTVRAGTGSIDAGGRVVDATGTPVVGVLVSAELELGPGVDAMPLPGISSTPAVGSVTGPKGEFVLRSLEAGRHRVEISGTGIFTSQLRFVEVPSDELSLIVARVVEVHGVLTERGVAAADVEVSLVGADGVRRTRSNQSGQFRFEALPEGIYRGRAAAGARAVPAQRLERLGAGPFDAVHWELGPATIVRGRVVDERGEGVVAEVRLSAVAEHEPSHYARSGAGGQFVIEGVVQGRWSAEAYASGYVAPEVISFEVGGSFVPVIPLRTGALLAGRVVTADGVPVSEALVSVRGDGKIIASAETRAQKSMRFHGALRPHSGGRFLPRGELGVLLGPIPFPPLAGAASVWVAEIVDDAADDGSAALAPLPVRPDLEDRFITDQDGRYQVGGLAAGSYRVIAAHRDFADGRSAEVELRRGGHRRDLRLVMHPGVTVTGTVRDQTGAVIVGATVISDLKGDPQARMQAVTGTDGVYTLGPIAADVTLRATAVAHGDSSRAIELVLAREKSERREDFVLARANAVLAGRISDASGFPVRGATVAAPSRDRSGTARTTTTDDTGRFELTGLAAGTYRLEIRHPGFPSHARKVNTGTALDLRLGFGGGIDGEIRDAHTRAAIAGALVVAKGPDKRELRTTSGADGALELVPLVPGSWSLQISAIGYATRRQAVIVPKGDRPRAITVTALRVSLERGATLGGVVRDGDGERVAGVRVSLGELAATTDEHGGFRLTLVPTGRVELRARKGALSGAKTLDLSPGDERVTLELTIR